MARPKKATVDYFPHHTTHGKTLFLLESRWGNDGYAIWFKTLERLGSSNGHFLDCRDDAEILYLAAFCRVQPSTLIEVYDTLANLGAIDPDLWRRKLVFSGNFVYGITDAYRKRINSLPTKEKLLLLVDGFPAGETEKPAGETPEEEILDAGSTERERERERENNNKTFSRSEDQIEEGEEEEEDFYLTKKGRKLKGKRLETFNLFWETFDYKDGKADAADAWLNIPKLTNALVEQIITAAKIEAERRPSLIKQGGSPKMAQGWLSSRRWEDARLQPKAAPKLTIDEKHSHQIEEAMRRYAD